MVTKLNLILPTQHNAAPMALSIKKVALGIYQKWKCKRGHFKQD